MNDKKLNKIKHLAIPGWWARRGVSPAAQRRIEHAIGESEHQHRGEIRFVAESTLPQTALRGVHTVRARAVDVFSEFRVWDTEENTGVLLYLQLIERRIEIVADRGITKRVAQSEWDAICKRMESACAHGRIEAGVIDGLAAITALLRREFPASEVNPNELPDAPVVR